MPRQDLQHNGSDLLALGSRRLQEREAGSQQEDTHQRESLNRTTSQCCSEEDLYSRELTYSQREGSPAFGVDKEQSWDGSNDLNGAVPERCVQSLSRGVTDILKNG